MAHYKLTGMVSHRHPFYGFDGPGDFVDTSKPLHVSRALADFSADNRVVYEALSADETPEAKVQKVAPILLPLVGGVSAGAVAYVVQRAFGIQGKKAAQVAFVLGSLSVFFSFAGRRLYQSYATPAGG